MGQRGIFCCPKGVVAPFRKKCDPYKNEFPEILAAAAMLSIASIFESYGVSIWLGGGHLLSIVRDQQMARCNDGGGAEGGAGGAEDLDAFSFLNDFCKLHSQNSPLHKAIRKAGFFIGYHETGYHDSIWVNKDNTLGLDFGHKLYDRDNSHEVQVDLAWVQTAGEDYLLGHKAWMKTCASFFDIRETIRYGVDMFAGTMQIPSRPERYLRVVFGNGWRRPQPIKTIDEREEQTAGCRYYEHDV